MSNANDEEKKNWSSGLAVESWDQNHVWSMFKREWVNRCILTPAALFVPVVLALFGILKKSIFTPNKMKYNWTLD